MRISLATSVDKLQANSFSQHLCQFLAKHICFIFTLGGKMTERTNVTEFKHQTFTQVPHAASESINNY